MSRQEHISTIIFALLFAVLIWLWAEGENREQRVETFMLAIQPVDADRFMVRIREPGQADQLLDSYPVEITLEGPAAAVMRMARAAQDVTIRLDNLQNEMARSVDLAEALGELPRFIDEGITIQRVEPSIMTVRVDALETRTVPVSTTMAGYDFDSIVLRPDRVEVRAPVETWETIVSPTVAATLVRLNMPASTLDELAPGEPATLSDVPLTLHPMLAGREGISVAPESVQVDLIISNRVVELRTTVPVKVLKLPQDDTTYEVAIDTEHAVIRDVIISGHPDIVERVQNRQVGVYAVINLSSDELEQGISEKQIEWLLPTGLTAEIAGGQPGARPTIPFTITRRTPDPS